MKDTKGILLWVCFTIELIVSILAVFFLNTSSDYFMPLVVIGITAGLAFIIMAVTEAVGSVRIGVTEKVMWAVMLVLISNIAGIIYLILRRKHIIQRVTD